MCPILLLRLLVKAILPLCATEVSFASKEVAVFVVSTNVSKHIATMAAAATEDTFSRLVLSNAPLNKIVFPSLAERGLPTPALNATMTAYITGKALASAKSRILLLHIRMSRLHPSAWQGLIRFAVDTRSQPKTLRSWTRGYLGHHAASRGSRGGGTPGCARKDS